MAAKKKRRRKASARAMLSAEYYLIEQEGSRFPELETAEPCLAAYNALRA